LEASDAGKMAIAGRMSEEEENGMEMIMEEEEEEEKDEVEAYEEELSSSEQELTIGELKMMSENTDLLEDGLMSFKERKLLLERVFEETKQLLT